ncbi:zinc finger FYVE domain-containing protein 9 isoform X3 [Nerophis ophidion]|uniref:zinc finger FYVE domain-containing protein 9 isoform X3 n=1 Tax=Nerophis ophidion TaxID=159077 RepID=UPI002AE04B41|nr:zinc finger FYVE domain-containing protein 9 isoform X3 [Nerophis ophidion]
MENYFQAEAFNLDKVLDDFEQNEDETDSPLLTDAKWTQILAPPSHLLSLNPALAHADLSPCESPLALKTLPKPSSNADTKRHSGGELPSWAAEERPADIHSPLLPQPNIGKLVCGDDVEDRHPRLDDAIKETRSSSSVQEADAHTEESRGEASTVSHFTFEMGQEQEETVSAERVETTTLNGQAGVQDEPHTEASQEFEQNRQSTSKDELVEHCVNGETDLQAAEDNSSPRNEMSRLEGHSEQLLSSPNGLELENGSRLNVQVTEEDEESLSPSPVPSKEDSVTEEKEMEESKQENGDGATAGGVLPKLNNSRLRPVSVPYGGARPKQPVSLKLQIPQPVTGQVQNQFDQSASSKNKNFDSRRGTPSETTPDVTPVGVNGDEVVLPSPLTLSSESPDNDIQAGQQGSLSRKQPSSLGEVAPVWVPDSQAPVCTRCDLKFTFTKRRHHCRACGKVFCGTCCSLKCKLVYMDKKEARVCVTCHSALTSASMTQEQMRVLCADGVLTNGDTAESPKPPSSRSLAVTTYASKTSGLESVEAAPAPVGPQGSPVGSALSLIPEDGLPPILISTGVKGGTGGHITDYAVEERPSAMVLMQQLDEGGPDPLVFVLNANLLAMVKLVNYVNRKCWYVTTKGMHAVGQAEVVILLQCLPDEKTFPKDIFTHFVHLYQEALGGNVLGHLSHSFFTQSFLGSKEHGGFLYISPSFQSLQDLLLPNPPFLFGVLIQKWETPWAKVFPIRLMLRLGAEYRLYPCPLFSVRFRKPLFGETGHTIMNLLADFRNYQYALPVVKGLVMDMEVRKTSIKIPSNRYNELMKAMNKSNEHVLAMGACFNERADSHLVCVQNDDGNYQTQAISIHHQPRIVTGACFLVFSGALKASSGFLAKTSIVEDGVMIQITAETMDSLRQALRDMKDFTITCGKADQEENQEHVHVQWTEDDHNFNKGVISPIDGKSMESITSVKIFHGSEFKANGKVIRWTEVFFLQSDDQPNGLSDPADHSRLTENVARAFCTALCPHLKLLKEDGMAKLGLRVTLDSDQVGYLVGSNGQPLLPQYLSDLDSALIPIIHGGACQLSEGPVVMELVFYILEIIS